MKRVACCTRYARGNSFDLLRRSLIVLRRRCHDEPFHVKNIRPPLILVKKCIKEENYLLSSVFCGGLV